MAQISLAKVCIANSVGYDGHEHVFAHGQQFPTCCGMRIPSAVAVAAALEPSSLKPTPFD